jgi:hypothetical protein
MEGREKRLCAAKGRRGKREGGEGAMEDETV